MKTDILGELYTEFTIGSRLYGGWKKRSDTDTLRIYKAPLAHVVSNVRRTIPSTITDQDDIRRSYLHDFVMSLGENPENTLFYVHYLDRFPDLDPDWILRESTARTMYESARKMFAKHDVVPPKQLGHAWRYMVGARHLVEFGSHEYPLEDETLDIYLELRAGKFPDGVLDMPEWEEFTEEFDSFVLPDRSRDLDQMALWVIEQYVGAGNRHDDEGWLYLK